MSSNYSCIKFVVVPEDQTDKNYISGVVYNYEYCQGQRVSYGIEMIGRTGWCSTVALSKEVGVQYLFTWTLRNECIIILNEALWTQRPRQIILWTLRHFEGKIIVL